MARGRLGAQFLLTLSTLLACSAWAARWEVVPTLSVGEIYTDNLSLVPDASRRSDWVTQVIPGISISAVGGSSQFTFSYAPELLYYAQGEGTNDVFHRLNALGKAELAEKLLFVDAGAVVGPQTISLLAPLSLSAFNTTGNVATVGKYYLSPYLRRPFGSAFQAEARYTYSALKSDDPNQVPSSVADRADLNFRSGPAYKQVRWSVDYWKEKIDYENQQDSDSEAVGAYAQLLVAPTVYIGARAGYEYYRTGTLEPASEGSSWGIGIDWAPTPRTQLRAGAGRRFYGKDYTLDFSHRTRLTTWSAGYSQDITTMRSVFGLPVTTDTAGYLDQLFLSQIPDPVARQKAVEEFIARTGVQPSLNDPVNFYTSQQFIEKRFGASAGIAGVRHVVIVNAFRVTREQLLGNEILPTTGDFVSSNTIIQTGGGLLWNFRVGARDYWNLRAGFSQNEFPGSDRLDDFAFLVMGFTRQLQPKASGSLNYRRQQNDSNVGADYTENAVFATLQMRF